LREWRRRSSDRAKLAMFDDRMLEDIGITRAEAESLSRKPFWSDEQACGATTGGDRRVSAW
jgi:uncharacterized protein YjiS (DUF1127 family)